MRAILNTRSVGSGMARILQDFCNVNNLKSPINHVYNIDERIPLSRWLQKLKYIDIQFKKEGLGLEIAKYCNASHIGISAYIAMSCKTLTEYVKLPKEYITIWYDQAPKQINILNNKIVISWYMPDFYKAGLFVDEMDLSEELKVAIIYQRIKQMTGIEGKIFERIEFSRSKPKNVKLYELYFNCPILFEKDKTSLIIYKDVYDVPFKTEDRILFEILKKQADIMLHNMPCNVTFVDIVCQYIIRAMREQDPRVNVVAEYLNMSPRTLQNKLKEYGLCFKDLLSKVRLVLAKQYLKDSEISIVEISTILGYKEQTSFNRSFKNWTGESPVKWRDNNMSDSNKSVDIYCI